jgi:hypothetical protein
MERLQFSGGMSVCPACSRQSFVLPLPALLEDPAAKPPPPPSGPPAEGEAACYYSPNRKATKDCSHCGVLMSDVWAAQWGAKSICLKCLEHLREKAKDKGFQTGVTRWDSIALICALIPFTLIFYWAAVLTAPTALVLSLWHWNSPRGVVPVGRWKLIVALLLSLAQVAGMLWGLANLLSLFSR